MSSKELALAFDIGHSSIGWAVFNIKDIFPHVVGCGTVLFPKDSCLAVARRGFRRSRRNIAARRSRIARLKNYFEKLGVLTRAQLDENANSYPWFLAARVLASDGAQKLSWQELWSVLRWYAHNRGYDGNALWAGDAVDAEDSVNSEDTEKVEAARRLMSDFGKKSMAETICAVLELDPLGEKKASRVYFKGKNAAFPRDVVVEEVRKILDSHKGVLPKLDNVLVEILLDKVPAGTVDNLPARFRGSLLFGQYVPRFDNRIIAKCRITGKNVPAKNCKEFFLYRWGRLINNLTVFADDGNARTLSPRERKALHAKMADVGFFTKKTLNEALREVSGCEPANTESYFMVEEMEEALVLDPVKKMLATKTYLKDLWKCFSSRGKKIFASKFAKGETLCLKKCVEQMKAWGGWDSVAFDAKLAELQTAEDRRRSASKRRNIINSRFVASLPDGRAVYSKSILKKVFEEALEAKDSTMEGGCLYETPEIRKRLLGESLESQTNNHMVRHRLMIFGRLLDDIVSEYAAGDASCVKDVVVEVVKELKEFSGMNAKEIAAKLTEKNGNFSMVAEKLEKAAMEANVPVTASLIRKARLLEDQGFICPYTGQNLSYNDLFGGTLDIEHIIPRSLRPSDSLTSCVMTFRAVNDMKGQRTAMQFIKDFEGKDVPGLNMQIQPLKDYKEWVDAHGKQRFRRGFYKEDFARCKKRSELMLLEKYDERNADFTERDLTQTSYLNKMAIRLVQQKLGVSARHLAGAITGFVRKNMCIDECLVAAVPRMQEHARVGEHDTRKLLKSEMRDLSHLHHAMDAVTQGLTALFFRVEDWKLLVKRNLNERERDLLLDKYRNLLKFSQDGKIAMEKLGDSQLKEIRDRLAECRVVQHVPAKMHGMAVEQTTWSILEDDENSAKVKLAQHTADLKLGRFDRDGKRFVKSGEEKKSLLLGYNVPAEKAETSKLQKIKGVVKICENWGCALDPTPTVIPYFKVFPKLRELREKNGGKRVRVIRRGQLISISSGRYKGVWRVVSIKNNATGIALDLSAPDKIKLKDKTAVLDTLLKNGLKILKPKLTGLPCPIISSQ